MYIYRKITKSLGKYDKCFKYYTEDNEEINDENIINYIKTLKIPPNYINVEINMNKKSKVLVTGYDKDGRKQYIYNKKFVENQMNKKNCNLIIFGQIKNKIENDINKFLLQKYLSKDKIISLILSIIIHCNFRIGNKIGKDRYNSFGVSTLLKKHCIKNNKSFILDFIGKKGIRNICELKDELIIQNLNILYKNCKGNESIFKYNNINISSNDVNIWLKKYGNITTKDFRSWYANIYFLEYILNQNIIDDIKIRKKNIIHAIKYVSEKMHHTPAICKKKYIIYDLFDIYLNEPIKFNRIFNNSKKNINKKLINYLKKYYC